MTYQKAVEYLESCRVLGSRPGLDSIKELLSRMDHPEQKIRVIHIAGTNGKGSTASFISHILASAGYKVGFFSSPAVYELREMIKLNNRNITEEEFAKKLEFTKQAAERMIAEGLFPPTEFEIMTATAYAFFSHSNCDYVVAECGMGGRLDATNVMESTEVSVLCRIAMDHTGFLGDTLASIAREKCGIMRKQTPVVIYPVQEQEAMDEIIKTAKEHSSIVLMPNKAELTIIESNDEGSLFSYGRYHNLKIKLPGQHQIFNALTAVMAIEALNENGADISEKAIKDGLYCANWSGRFEVLDKNLPVILDGAHNMNGVQAFVETMKTYYPKQSFIGVVGMLRDKEYMSCLTEFAKVCRFLVLTEVANPRTATVEELAQAAKQIGVSYVTVPSPEEAVCYAFAKRDENEGIFCVGSLYNLATFKNVCKHKLIKQ